MWSLWVEVHLLLAPSTPVLLKVLPTTWRGWHYLLLCRWMLDMQSTDEINRVRDRGWKCVLVCMSDLPAEERNGGPEVPMSPVSVRCELTMIFTFTHTPFWDHTLFCCILIVFLEGRVIKDSCELLSRLYVQRLELSKLSLLVNLHFLMLMQMLNSWINASPLSEPWKTSWKRQGHVTPHISMRLVVWRTAWEDWT